MKKLLFVVPVLAIAACAWFQGGSANITPTQQTVTVVGPDGQTITVSVQDASGACVTDSKFESLPFLLPNIECDIACASWAVKGDAEVQLTCRVKGTTDTFPLVLYSQGSMSKAKAKSLKMKK